MRFRGQPKQEPSDKPTTEHCRGGRSPRPVPATAGRTSRRSLTRRTETWSKACVSLVERGVDAAELDVRRTADKILVVHHDEHWEGLTLERTSYGELLEQGAHLRTLDDVLGAADGRIAVDLELKEAGYEADVLSTALAHVALERLIVTSFLDEVVRAVKVHAPAVRAGLLLGRRPTLRAPATLLADAFPFGRLDACGADFLAPHALLLATALRRRARSRGMPLLLWTVNDVDSVRAYLAEPGLLGVVTDSPEALETPCEHAPVRWPFPAGSSLAST